MPERPQKYDWWKPFTFALWMVFFFVGMVPELVYFFFRQIGQVPTQRAIVNSPMALTVALSLYLGIFVYRRCRIAGMGQGGAQARAFQVAVLGLVAFLGMPQMGGTTAVVSLVGILFLYREIPDFTGRVAVLITGIGKLALWWYLLTLMLRYYLFSDDRVFFRMVSLLPSTHGVPLGGNEEAVVDDGGEAAPDRESSNG